MKKNNYICCECGYVAGMPMGKCPQCGNYNTFSAVELKKDAKKKEEMDSSPVRIDVISDQKCSIISSGIDEFDRVFGGGLTPCSIVLLVGDPGIGKSSLVLKTAQIFQDKGNRVLYITGEESLNQIKLRWLRLVEDYKTPIDVLSETNVDSILEYLEGTEYNIIIVDSIQTMYSPTIFSTMGSVNQVRYTGMRILQFIKTQKMMSSNPCFILIGHVTKEGITAGPKALEHLVDVVLYLEGDKQTEYRLLKSHKNRFGPTTEIGIFEMKQNGLIPVVNPSQIFIDKHSGDYIGTAITPSLQGQRVIFAEIQSLFAEVNYPNPRRISKGIKPLRLNMIIAILEKRCNLSFYNKEIYVNIASGLVIEDTVIDLAIAASLISNFYDKPLEQDTAFFGELSLNGEIKKSQYAEKRLNECLRLGYKKIYCPYYDKDLEREDSGCEIIGIKKIEELLKRILLYEDKSGQT